MKTLKKLSTYLLFNGAHLLLGIVSVPIITSLMSPSEFGRAAIFLSVLAIYLPLVSISTDSYFPVELAKHKDFQIVRFTLFATFLVLMLFGSIMAVLSVLFLGADPLFLIMPFFAFIRSIKNSQLSELVFNELAGKFGLSNLSLGLIGLCLSYLFLKVLGGSAEARVLALVIAEVLVTLALVKELKLLNGRSLFRIIELKRAIKFSIPITCMVLPAWLINEYGKIYVSEIDGLASVGVLAIAFQLAFFQLQTNGSVGNAFLKPTYNDISRAFSTNYNLVILLSMICLNALGYFTIKLFGSYLVSVEFLGALQLIEMLFVGVLFQSLTLMPSFVLNFHKKTGYRLVCISLAALVNVLLLHVFGSPAELLPNVVQSFAISMLVYMLLMYISMYKVFRGQKTTV